MTIPTTAHAITGTTPRRSCSCGSSVATGTEVLTGDRVAWCSQSGTELQRTPTGADPLAWICDTPHGCTDPNCTRCNPGTAHHRTATRDRGCRIECACGAVVVARTAGTADAQWREHTRRPNLAAGECGCSHCSHS